MDFLREDLGLTGTHVGCEHGVCGACTIHFNGEAVRSCIMLAVQADGAQLHTIEGLAAKNGDFHPLQQAFHENHGLQCGFCTPGMLMTALDFLRINPAHRAGNSRGDVRRIVPLYRLSRYRALGGRRGGRMRKNTGGNAGVSGKKAVHRPLDAAARRPPAPDLGKVNMSAT